jgi:hypothetical protein
LARAAYIFSVYDRICGDFPAQNSVYTPYMYGSGEPYLYIIFGCLDVRHKTAHMPALSKLDASIIARPGKAVHASPLTSTAASLFE